MTEARGLGLRVVPLIFALIFGICLVGLSTPADASRAPSKKERKSIRKAAMKHCKRTQKTTGDYGCEWRGGVRVSTVNRRYAWANVSGPHYENSGILRRKHPRSRKWKVVRVVGGGIQPCSYWYAKAPRKVVRDFKVRGFDENSGNFDYHRC